MSDQAATAMLQLLNANGQMLLYKCNCYFKYLIQLQTGLMFIGGNSPS